MVKGRVNRLTDSQKENILMTAQDGLLLNTGCRILHSNLSIEHLTSVSAMARFRKFPDVIWRFKWWLQIAAETTCKTIDLFLSKLPCYFCYIDHTIYKFWESLHPKPNYKNKTLANSRKTNKQTQITIKQKTHPTILHYILALLYALREQDDGHFQSMYGWNKW